MSRVLKSFYRNLIEPVAILEFNSSHKLENLTGASFNDAFRKAFAISDADSDIKILKRLDYKFHFDFCLLEAENLTTYSPLIDAIEGEMDFSTYGAFQKNEREFLYFSIRAFSLKKYRILYFCDVTGGILLEKFESENKKLKNENREFFNSSSKAQNQAVKMALLNRISSSISKTIDVKDLILTALNELSMIFAAKKVYFAKRLKSKNAFKIEYNIPEAETGEIIEFDELTTDEIFDNKISTQVCLKENENSKPLPTPITRIILPCFKKEELVGAVCVFTSKKTLEKPEEDFLQSVSMQISNAITQAMLFSEVSKQKEELEAALTELKETQLQLINSEKMASLGQLIASVAHEINTPLASVSANNEIAKKLVDRFETFDKDTVEILKDINSIDTDAIRRITNLVQSLKRFVRLDEENLQEANINEELDLTLNLLHHKLKRNIVLIKNYSDIPPVKCYPNMLNQVFLNITMNAIQSVEKEFEQKGAPYEPQITVSTGVEGAFLLVKIEDNGQGIKEENKKKIFQAGFTTKKVGEGTGLGLAICKKIIEKHKGEITFESKPAKASNTGKTVFTVSIPL